MKPKIDPYTGEEFIPKRRNQIFANNANKTAFNNKKAAKIKAERSVFDDVIKRNYAILKLVLDNALERTVHYKTLDEIGFKFNYYLKHEIIQGKHLSTIYDISFQIINDAKNNTIYTKIFKS